MNSAILLYIIRIVIGGIVSFFAILLMSKTRMLEWMLIVAGCLLKYVGEVIGMCLFFNVFVDFFPRIAGVSLFTLLDILIPSLCFIAAFIVKILKK